jgi:hypothetical protein
MAEASWQEAVAAIAPYIIKISTPDHSGTGFLFAFGAMGGICGFATAAHALAHAHEWEQPIRIEQGEHVRVVHPSERAIVIHEETDTAALVILREESPFPIQLLPMTPEGTNFRVGVEIGWLGFPGVAQARDQLCFFSGRISAWLAAKHAYLVDGVAISGVSGGPAFHFDERGNPVLMGVVSAYLPNKVIAGSPLPGLSLVQHIGKLEKVVNDLRELGQKSPVPAD